MPRDGSGIYSRPPGTNAVPDTTIESTKYNGFVGDVETDLNAPRPIIAGGTGATSAAAARTNLKAEVSVQQVTNYDTHVFEAGSFYSTSGATGAPDAGGIWSGVCTMLDATAIQLTARNYLGGVNAPTFFRTKVANVWGAWVSSDSINDARYVNVTGDVMTGDLNIQKVEPTLALTKTAANQNAGIYGNLNGVNRWFMGIGDGTPETGGSVGSNFALYRYNDAGGFIDVVFAISRSTGQAAFQKLVNMPLGFATPAGWPLQFEWNGVAIQRSVSGGPYAAMYDMVNSPSASAGGGAYQKFVTGQILQFGIDGGGGGEKLVTFPVAFPAFCQTVVVTMIAGGIPADTEVVAHVDGIGQTGFLVRPRYRGPGGGGIATQGFCWYAVGY